MTPSESAFKAFKTQLSRYISKRLGKVQDVEDILQEVFVRATRYEEKLGEVREPLAWLYTVTNSVISDHYRKQARGVSVIDNAEINQIPAPLPLTEQDFARCLRPVIDTLPAKYRDALMYVDINGGAQNALAQEQGLAVSTVKSQVQRGRKLLKSAIVACCHVEIDEAGVGLSPRGDCC